MKIVVIFIMPVLTVWWAHGVYHHFIRHPKGTGFDWGMTHGMHLGLGTGILVGLWTATWKLFTAGLADLIK